MLAKNTTIDTGHMFSLNKEMTPDIKMPELALPNRVMPTIGKKLAGTNRISPAIESAKVRSMLCFRGLNSNSPQRGQWIFSPILG